MSKITKYLKPIQKDDKESKEIITIVDKTDEDKPPHVKKRKASTSPIKVRR
jgi:hypothetical protein